MKNGHSQGSAAVVILIIVVGLAILGMVNYIFFKSSLHKSLSTNTQTVQPTNAPPSPTPTIAVDVKDFAPAMPMSQKTTILIQHSDSSETKYIVPTSMSDTYIRSLPMGDKIISKSP